MNGERTLVAVGDSLTNDEPDNWLQVLARSRGGVRAVAEAHGGWTTRSYFKDKFEGVAFASLPPHADVCVILIGSNNLFEAGGGSEAAIEEACAGVERIAGVVRERCGCGRFVLAAPPSVCLPNVEMEAQAGQERRIEPSTPEWIRRLGDAYRELAAERGWEFVDLFPLLGDEDFVDAAHPTAEGQRTMAGAIGGAVDRVLG